MRGLKILETRRSRDLRANSTRAEARLWARPRNRQLGGFKFVRQMSVGPSFADFACREQKLTVEIDGATHSADAEIAHDARRARVLSEHGFHTMRFYNLEVFEYLQGVLETILAALEKRTTL